MKEAAGGKPALPLSIATIILFAISINEVIAIIAIVQQAEQARALCRAAPIR